jgi:hypothetical protein
VFCFIVIPLAPPCTAPVERLFALLRLARRVQTHLNILAGPSWRGALLALISPSSSLPASLPRLLSVPSPPPQAWVGDVTVMAFGTF